MNESRPALAAALQRRADHYNALYRQASAATGLDGEAFGAHLRTVVAPIVEAVATSGAEADIDAVTSSLYELSLRLAGRRMVAADAPHQGVHRLWTELLPKWPGLLVEAPRRLPLALTNAAVKLHREGDDAFQRWLEILEACADAAHTADELLQSGQVAAWRVGLAEFRDSALAVWEGLPPTLKIFSVGARDVDLDIVADVLRLRWPQQSTLTYVGSAGGFTGFGEDFAEPPIVENRGGTLVAFDGESFFEIHADRFGARCHRVRPEQLPDSVSAPSIDDYKEALSDARSDFASPASFAATDHTLALTLEHSYRVFLFAPPSKP